MKRGEDWTKPEKRKSNRPPGLRGKEIGLYYRNLNQNKNKDEPKKPRENLVNLTIPRAIINTLAENIATAEQIAQENNILLGPLFSHNLFKKIDPKIKTTTSSKVDVSAGSSDSSNIEISAITEQLVVKSNFEIKKDYIKTNDSQPGPSTKINNELSALEGAGDYKYSFEDIITGTFEEKLDECLTQGITINETNEETENMSAALYAEYEEIKKLSQFKSMMEFRETLPTYKKAQEILETVENNQIVVISGETGCGKSTQVPQLILDDAILKNKGANVKILVTQPRRIAASSLAMRVAKERAEKLGNSVGFAVRLERVHSRPRGSIMFVTTGILLAELEVNQGLTNISHIILDEVHERNCDVDLSMCMLKQVLKKRQDLKLILMSATIDADRLSAYFDNCPMLHIEGLAYPVTDVYLEDILAQTKYKLKEVQNNKPRFGKFRPHWGASRDMEIDIRYKKEIHSWLESKKKDLDYDVYKTLQDSRIELLDLDLILELLKYICLGPPGAVLVFLPGIGDISKLSRMMETSQYFPKHKYDVYSLHSKLPSLEQHKIFDRPPNNVRKIIIATNIAETSITIDDIVYVIDCGRIKITGLNIEENISTLQTVYESQANLRQRRGRAGRCQPGTCYHLLTSYRASSLPPRVLPELQRSDLLEPVLCVKRLRLGPAAPALALVPDPPAPSTIQWAVSHLQK